MNSLKFWFFHHIYCSHPADFVVNVGEPWDWACIRCEQMVSATGPTWFWWKWLKMVKYGIERWDQVIFGEIEEEDLPF